MNKVFLMSTLVCVISSAGPVQADTVTYPASYANIAAGKAAKASDVTDAFSAVKSAVDANDGLISGHETRINALESAGPVAATVSYKNYDAAANVSKRTYNWVSFDTVVQGCNTEIHQITRTATGNPEVTNVTLKLTRTDDPTSPTITCQNQEYGYQATATDYLYTSRKHFNSVNGNLLVSYQFNPPVALRTTAMQLNVPMVSTAEISESVNGTVSHMIESETLLGKESVTVPAGTYTDCIKMQVRRNSAENGFDINSIDWYCAGVGLTKRVRTINFVNQGKIVSHNLELTAVN